MRPEYYEIPIVIRSQTIEASGGIRSGEVPQTASEIASQWGLAYEDHSGNEIVCVDLGSLTYGFDIAAERLVYVTGKTSAPGVRDRSRQQGNPKPSEEDDEKGHVIATSLGGGMDINLIPQARSVNRGKGSQWASIERKLAKRPGSAVAIHLSTRMTPSALLLSSSDTSPIPASESSTSTTPHRPKPFPIRKP
jgi:DNA/RNA non-specific endonuclease